MNANVSSRYDDMNAFLTKETRKSLPPGNTANNF